MQRKKMFLVVCISALLTGGVQGQNFLPEKGKWVPERLEWRDEALFLPAIPGMDFSHLRKTGGGGFLSARGRGKEIFRDQIMGAWSPREEMSMTRMSALLPWERAVIPADGVAAHFGFFCRRELELEKTIRLPLRFRLGSLEYCNRLEGK